MTHSFLPRYIIRHQKIEVTIKTPGFISIKSTETVKIIRYWLRALWVLRHLFNLAFLRHNLLMPASTCQPDAPYGKGAVQKSPAKEKKRQVTVIGAHGDMVGQVDWVGINSRALPLFHHKKKAKASPSA